MSTSVEYPQIPEFDLADRMRKALRISGLSQEEMADYLGVSRNTVSNWINGHWGKPPRDAYLRLWALRTGVPYEWLKKGKNATAGNGGGSPTPWYPLHPVTNSEPVAISVLPLAIPSAAAA